MSSARGDSHLATAIVEEPVSDEDDGKIDDDRPPKDIVDWKYEPPKQLKESNPSQCEDEYYDEMDS